MWKAEEDTTYREENVAGGGANPRDGDSGDDGSGDDGSSDDGSGDDEDDLSEDDDGTIRRSLGLLYPWVEYTGSVEVSVDANGDVGMLERFSKGDLQADVAPCGVFQRKGLKFDRENSDYRGNESVSSDRWYYSAALVVAPLQVSTSWALQEEDESEVLQKWFKLADTKPAHARVIARLFGNYEYEWSTTSPLGIQILETVAKLADADAVCGVLSAFASVEFQPKLRDVMAPFDRNTLAKITKTVGQKWRRKRMNAERNCCNFIASVLDGVADRATIAAVVEVGGIALSVKSDSVEKVELSERDPTPEEFVRLLHLSSLVSEDCVKGILDSSQARSLVLVGIPAIRLLLAATRDQPSKGAVVLTCANHALDLVKKNLPAIRAMSYKSRFGCSSYYSDCKSCGPLRSFLDSEEEATTVEKNIFESHLKKKLREANFLDRLSIEPSSDSAEQKVNLTKSYESPLFKKALEEIAGLNAMVVEYVRVAVVSGSRGAGSK